MKTIKPIVQFDHFAIVAPGKLLDDLVVFYERVLELKPGYYPDIGLPGYWLYSGDLALIHLIGDDSRKGASVGYFDHIAFRCNDHQATLSRLQAHDIEFEQVAMEREQQLLLFVTDPAGTVLELNFSLH